MHSTGKEGAWTTTQKTQNRTEMTLEQNKEKPQIQGGKLTPESRLNSAELVSISSPFC